MDNNPIVIDPNTQIEVIRSLADKLKAYYIYPDIAENIHSQLNKHLEQGNYSDITEGDLFALALTLHMQEVNHDEHLWVRWHQEPLPEDDDFRHNRLWQEERLLEARRDNFGIYKVERLPGNIGYLDIRYFHRAAWGGDTVTAAMNFLANVSALIIDLRKCTGGYPAMICLIISYFFGEEPIHISSIYWRDDDITQQYWTLPYIPGKRLGDIPIYVLTSKHTFSGGEGFASILQSRKRATVIGEKTDGGAHPGASYRLHPHFEAFIPIGRGIDPVTGKDLEGIGVIPNIIMPQEHAFLAAYNRALVEVLGSLGESPAGSCKALAKEAQMALNDLESNQ
jgi:C-terminal processing protease CtpA/Prc